MDLRYNIAIKANALAIAAILATAPVATLRAQSPAQDNWDNLRQINPGQQVQIVLMNAQSYRGKFVGYNDQALSLTTKDNDTAFNRDQVVRVSMLDSGKRKRNTMLGLASASQRVWSVAACYTSGSTTRAQHKKRRICSSASPAARPPQA